MFCIVGKGKVSVMKHVHAYTCTRWNTQHFTWQIATYLWEYSVQLENIYVGDWLVSCQRSTLWNEQNNGSPDCGLISNPNYQTSRCWIYSYLLLFVCSWHLKLKIHHTSLKVKNIWIKNIDNISCFFLGFIPKNKFSWNELSVPLVPANILDLATLWQSGTVLTKDPYISTALYWTKS